MTESNVLKLSDTKTGSKRTADGKRIPKSKQNKSMSIKEWMTGIATGTVEQHVNTYYDNIKGFDPEFQPKDTSRMTRIELLQEHYSLTKYIDEKTKEVAASATTTSTKRKRSTARE